MLSKVGSLPSVVGWLIRTGNGHGLGLLTRQTNNGGDDSNRPVTPSGWHSSGRCHKQPRNFLNMPSSDPPQSPMSNFQFSFDPNAYPAPSADLFSPTETSHLLGFLDNFTTYNWENDHYAPYSNPHYPEGAIPRRAVAPPSRAAIHAATSSTPPTPRSASTTSSDSSTATVIATPTLPVSRTRPLLSTPQKRLNHIMSEQKRRNAIRDGYAQLIALLTPAGSGPVIGMPTRGRPKGSGSRGNGQTKGKSGVLFRAVEYCKWLEEGRNALLQEVLRVEQAAGVRHR